MTTSIRSWQSHLPWGAHSYSKAFEEDKRPHRDFDHVIKHITKDMGKLAEAVDNMDHDIPVDKKDVEKAMANIQWCLLRAANCFPSSPIDLEDALVDRIKEKMVYGTVKAAPDKDEEKTRKVQKEADAASDRLEVLSQWQHYKGGKYRLASVSVNEADLTILVHYWSEEKGGKWTRPLEAWEQLVELPDGSVVPRFRRIT